MEKILVLIVDDTPMMRKIIAQKLEEAGYTNIILASNGEEAWNKLTREERIKIIITDLSMPVMGGKELLEKIRGSEDLNLLPVIIISTEMNESIAKKFIQMGATACWNKGEITSELIKQAFEKIF